MERRIFKTSAARWRFLAHAILATLGALVVVILIQQELRFLLDPVEARTFVASFGSWAPAVLIILQALQVVLAPIPGQVLAVVAGYLFGPWWGTLYNMIGIAIGSTVAFWLARRYGRAYVERFIHREALERFDGVGDHHTLVTLLVLFLIPGLPDDVLCFAGGLTLIPLRRLIMVAVIGRTPAFFLANVFGGLLGAGDSVSAAVLLALIMGASGIGYIYRHEIIDFLTSSH